MVGPNSMKGLASAWRALSGVKEAQGWQTIPYSSVRNCRLLAGRRFPGNEESLLIGFRSATGSNSHLLPQGQGFEVEQVNLDLGDEWAWIALSRSARGNLGLFERMASDVAASLVSLPDLSGQALRDQALVRIRAWQEFMKRGNGGRLGKEAEVGLFGELVVLQKCIELGIPESVVMDSWHGPLDGLHDFVGPVGGLEVKTSVGGGAFRAKVGSLDQLDISLCCPLFLAAVRTYDLAAGMTLSEKVQQVTDLLENSPASQNQFNGLLLQAGFASIHQDLYTRTLGREEMIIHRVDEDFPCLTRGTVSAAIVEARYSMVLPESKQSSVNLPDALHEIGVC